jgi:tRNA(Ile2) C34 agmatinyltransferase TiaS
MAKERLEELAGEKAYLAKRKEADQAYNAALKDGATEEQATKLAEKILGSIRGFKRGGMLSVKKK